MNETMTICQNEKYVNKKTALILRITTILLVLMVFLSSTTVYAKSYLTTLNRTYDLFPNKAITYYNRYANQGFKPETVKLTNFKTTKLSNGKKKTTFTLTFNTTSPSNISKKEIHKLSDFDSFAFSYYAIIDSSTGYCVCPSEYFRYDDGEEYDFVDYYDEYHTSRRDYRIKVSDSDFKYSNTKYYYDYDGCYIYLSTRVIKVTITYPANRKNLCLVAGGENAQNIYVSDAERKFMYGYNKLANSPFYKKSTKKNCLFKKIS